METKTHRSILYDIIRKYCQSYRLVSPPYSDDGHEQLNDEECEALLRELEENYYKSLLGRYEGCIGE